VVPVDWLLLDIGGVLEIVDDRSWPGEWTARWTTRLGLDPEELLRLLAGDRTPETAAMRADFWDAYCGTANELLDVLRDVRGRVRLSILSNSADGARDEEERRYGFSSLFDPICYSHETGVAKPDPEAFATVLARMGADPGRVLFIDDLSDNIDAARALGLRTHLHVGNAGTIAAIRAATESDAPT
jgi:HAD superfamily hydrolase (TIGR01509 family)